MPFPSCSYKYHHIPSSIKIPSWWYQHSTQCPSTPCYPRLLRGFGKQLCCFAKMSSLAALRPILQICCSPIAITCRNMSQNIATTWSAEVVKLGFLSPGDGSTKPAECLRLLCGISCQLWHFHVRHQALEGHQRLATGTLAYCDAYWAGCCLLLFVASPTVGISWDQRHV